MLTQSVLNAFAPNGALANQVKQYRPRQSQLDMAKAVAEAISQKHNLIVEAGTGVGKTYAYLIPALLSSKQIVISTGTKNLQEQLYFHDLPALIKTLGYRRKIALLKGRSNYLCQLRLKQQLAQAATLDDKFLDDVLKIQQWSSITQDGDIGNLTAVAEDSPAVAQIVSTKDSCTGKRCDFYDECFTRKARIKAMEAKVIVVNHHLFFADRLLKDTGFAELLPDPDVVIFDEAHLVPDISINNFGSLISTKEIERCLSSIIKLHQSEIKDSILLEQYPQRALQLLSQWQNQVLDADISDWRHALSNKSLMQCSWELYQRLVDVREHITHHLGRHEQLDELYLKLVELIDKLNLFFECTDDDSAYSVDANSRYLHLRQLPINVAKQCQNLFLPNTQWIFTSATLQVNQSLDHFESQLGFKNTQKLMLTSPFDYANQAVFCVPRHLGRVGSDSNMEQFILVCLQAIDAAQGRTFILFTSHSMMQKVASELQRRTRYPLLIQGQGAKQNLLNKFRQLGHAVLLGTGSFWEGVDMRGKLLSCVIIDKLPFVSPDDTLYRARAANAQRQGEDPFLTISLPQAVTTLQQGVGRLIRDEKDKGVLILCDNRIVNRNYGYAFINSLPPMKRTRDLDAALHFLKQIS